MADPRVEELIATLQAAGWNPGVSQQGASNRILARFTEVVNPVDNGADPTGVTDSTVAFNASIAKLGTYGLFSIPPGLFTINGVLSNIPANCTVTGAGEYTTTLNTNIASGAMFTLNGATTTLQNLTVNNTNPTNNAAVVSHNANQVTVQNLSIIGFGSSTGIISMTSAATFGNVFNIFMSSSVAGAVGIAIAGSDTVVQGCTMVNLPVGLQSSVSDRFTVVDCILKACTIGVQIANTSAAGSTTYNGLQFNTCTTGVSVTPGNGQATQAMTFDGCVFDQNTNSIVIAPTGTGTVTFIDFDGCDIISTVNGNTGININGAGANSVQYVSFDGVDIACTGTSSVGFSYTSGGTANAPIMFTGCDFNSTTNSVPAPGASNAQPFVFRFSPGVNPIGKSTTQPATGTGAITNLLGADATVYLVAGTASNISVGGQVVFTSPAAASPITVRVPFNQNITTSVAASSWTWVLD